MNLYDYLGKKVKVLADNGKTFVGDVEGVTPYFDNSDDEPPYSSIIVGYTILYENEIVSIEVLE